MRKRLIYGGITLLLLLIEVLIALFVNDRFIRPYFGDMLVVVVLYTFVRILIPDKHPLLPLWIFLFSAGVEVLQGLHLVELLGLGNSRFFRVLLGSVFDVKDILCYGIGCLFLGVWEYLLLKKHKADKEDDGGNE